jgi:hypothetical protein
LMIVILHKTCRIDSIEHITGRKHTARGAFQRSCTMKPSGAGIKALAI